MRTPKLPHGIARATAAAGLLGTSLLALGCPDETAPELERFETCDELATWIKASAIDEIEYQPPPPVIGVPRAGGDVALEGDDDDGGATTTADNGVAGPQGPVAGGEGNRAWSTTNVQEDGVDEADFVKNDGDHLFVLDRSGLNVYDAWPAEELHLLSRTTLEGMPQSMYFDAVDTVVVLSVLNGSAAPASGGAGLSAQRVGWWAGDPITKVSVFDVSDRADPQLTREVYVDGQIRTSRRIGDKLHLVAYNNLMDFVYSATSTATDPLARVIERRQRIDESVAEDWIPQLQDHRKVEGGWTSTSGPIAACSDVYRPDLRTELHYAGLLTLDLADPAADIESVGVFTRADTVYASAGALYMAMTEWDSGPFRSRDDRIDTRLHKFALDDGDAAPRYTASGIVSGSLLNQFSMSEHQGDLRVATTTSEPSSAVYVLEQDGTRLEPVGEVTGIAPGETIFAVRFQGDKGYVVTFERIDPLFTLDLSDRTNPRVVGELEVTGFSNYLHPVGDEHLLAVGEEIAPNGWEWIGLQVSLFDVSNFARPSLLDREVLATGSSEAQYDHHAFTFFEELSTLALPVYGWDYAGYGQTALELFDVDTELGLERIGSIDHSVMQETSDDTWEWWGCSQVRRTVFIEDYVFAISDQGVQVVMMGDPETTIALDRYEDPGCKASWWGWGWEGDFVR